MVVGVDVAASTASPVQVEVLVSIGLEFPMQMSPLSLGDG